MRTRRRMRCAGVLYCGVSLSVAISLLSDGVRAGVLFCGVSLSVVMSLLSDEVSWCFVLWCEYFVVMSLLVLLYY